jgi:hypothetical protein
MWISVSLDAIATVRLWAGVGVGTAKSGIDYTEPLKELRFVTARRRTSIYWLDGERHSFEVPKM